MFMYTYLIKKLYYTYQESGDLIQHELQEELWNRE